MQPVCGRFWHTPSSAQTSVVQEVPSRQSSAVLQSRQPGIGVLVQLPASQASPDVQGLWSLQAVPLVAVGLEQTPVSGLQAPGTWHWSTAPQTTGVPPHEPPWQESLVVHALPSLQDVPSSSGGKVQPAWGSQVSSSVQGLPSLQTSGVPDW